MTIPDGSSPLPRRSTGSALLTVHALAALTVVMWGVSFVSTAVLLDHGIGPVAVYVARFMVAYVLMWALAWRRVWARSVRDELLLAICGLCGSTIYYLAENYALKYTLATNVSLITSMSPLVTLLLAGIIYKSDRPSGGALTGSALAFLGVGCVIFNSSFVMKVNPLGDLLSLAATLAFAVYTLLLRKLQALYDIAFITRKTFFYGLVTAIPFVVFSPERVPLSVWCEGVVLGNFLFLALGCTVAAFLIWGWIVKKIGPVKSNNYLYFQPVVTLIFSAIVLGEPVTAVGILGMVLILAGVVLYDKMEMRARRR